MPWFFTDEEINSEKYNISGETARHILKSLRMKTGEELTLVTPAGVQNDCRICDISGELLAVEILKSYPCENEPNTKAVLYQALPKGDKMELIIQKCVELGISKIVPVLTARCISRPDEKSMKKKLVRWNKIAKEAASQSRRGIIPEVTEVISFKKAVEDCKENDVNLIFYELGGKSIKTILKNQPESVGFFVGSEGGFEENEIGLALENGIEAATLGKRILRAETAPIAALSIIMYELNEMDSVSTTGKEFANDRNYLCNEN